MRTYPVVGQPDFFKVRELIEMLKASQIAIGEVHFGQVASVLVVLDGEDRPWRSQLDFVHLFYLNLNLSNFWGFGVLGFWGFGLHIEMAT